MATGEAALPPIGQDVVQRDAAEIAAERQRLRGVGHLPSNRDQARWELETEDRVRFSSRPRNRRWKALAKFDEAVEAGEQRYVKALDDLRRAEEALKAAPDDDARTLAGWISGGERGRRPVPSEPDLRRERDAHKLLAEASARALDVALVKRRDHVERHRSSMLSDASAATPAPHTAPSLAF